MDKIPVKLLTEGNRQLAGEDEILTEDEVLRIRSLHKQGWGIKRIARELSISRNTVRKYGRDGGERGYHREIYRKRVLEGEEDWIKEKFFQHDGNADVIRQELKTEKGLNVSLRTVERAVKCYREDLKRKELATVRFETPPGFQMQIDFGEKWVLLGDRREKVHLFVAKLGFSRRIYVQAFSHENLNTWIEGVEGALRYFEGVPVQVLIDNAKAMVIDHNPRTHEVKLNETFKTFAAYWGFGVRACMPGRPRTKGKVENGVKYVKRNCLAGRKFENWGKMEGHIGRWLVEESDNRGLGEKGDTPRARFEAEEQQVLKPLEEGRPPFSPIVEKPRKVSHDCFVKVGTNRYSVPWEHIRKEVQVQLTKDEVIIQLFDGLEIARHKRCTDRYKTIENPEHFKGIIFQKDETKVPVDEAVFEESSNRELRRSELERPLSEYEKAVRE